MKRLHAITLTALASAVIAQTGWAQTLPTIPVDTPVQHLHLSLDTGVITPDSPAGEAVVTSCFGNSAFSGFYGVTTLGAEWVDWGTKSCGLTGAACEFVIGYGTTALDPGASGPGASIDVTIYGGTTGFCDAKTPIASYSFTGLPGSPDGVAVSAFTLTVDIGTLGGFLLADGPIGWGYTGTDGTTGPLLIFAPDPGTGTADAFDLYSPAPASAGSCAGTFAFTTPGISSFWMEISEDDGAFGPGVQTLRPGTGCNIGILSLDTAGPVIGGTWSPSITNFAVGSPMIDFIGFASTAAPGGCFGGLEILIGTSPPNPILVLSGPFGAGSPFSIPVPSQCALIGIAATCQAGQVGFASSIGLTNAIDITIGI